MEKGTYVPNYHIALAQFSIDSANTNPAEVLGIENLKKLVRFGAKSGKEIYDIIAAKGLKRLMEAMDLISLANEFEDVKDAAVKAWKEAGDLNDEEVKEIGEDIADEIPNFSKRLTVEQQRVLIMDLIFALYLNVSVGERIALIVKK